jgi:uncharacterized protein YutE (UPF0331/DUF86 family)
MVDAERLRSLLDRLADVETELRRLRELRREAVADDPDRLNSLKYLFVLAAEVAIDIGQHVIAAEGLRAPGSFAAVFDELGRAGWVSADLAGSLGAMARFRNLLVHGYADVDDARVVEILHGASLDDLGAFRTAIAQRTAT